MNDAGKYDLVVLGLGIMGSAVAYQAAKLGLNVLGIDQYELPHNLGSTHGSSRITRQAIGEGEHYTPLVLRSNQIWRELEAETGLKLLEEMDLLIVSSDDQTTVSHVPDFFNSTVRVAKKYGIDHELLTAEEIRNRFPAYAVTNEEYGYLEKGAGVLQPENCLIAQLQMARKHGAELRTAEKVVYYGEAEGGMLVNTSKGEYHTSKVAICAGGWLPELLDDKLKDIVKIYRQTLFWFNSEASAGFYEKNQFPLFVWELSGFDSAFYGFPTIDGAGVKVATEQYFESSSLDSIKREVDQSEIDEIYENFVRHKFPGLKNDCVKASACVYTVSSDFHFILDWHPEMESVFIVSPCSGHGFKHASAIGEAVAQKLIGRQSDLDVSAFRLWRFL
jgi:sarcosine oxidase